MYVTKGSHNGLFDLGVGRHGPEASIMVGFLRHKEWVELQRASVSFLKDSVGVPLEGGRRLLGGRHGEVGEAECRYKW